MPPRRRKGASDPKPVHRSPQTLTVSLSLKLLCPFAIIDLKRPTWLSHIRVHEPSVNHGICERLWGPNASAEKCLSRSSY